MVTVLMIMLLSCRSVSQFEINISINGVCLVIVIDLGYVEACSTKADLAQKC